MKLGVLCLFALVALASAEADVPCSYIVQPGDSAWDLASRYGLTSEEVQAANPDVPDLAYIRAGDLLSLPCAVNATSADTVLDLLAHRADTKLLFAAALAAGPDFVKTLNDSNFKATVFAPNDTAFETLLETLGKNASDLLADKPLLQDLLSYHVVPGTGIKAAQLDDGRNLTTLLDGEYLVVSAPKDMVRLITTSGQKVRLTQTDLKGGKAVVHLVRRVLWPASAPLAGVPPEDECVHVVALGDTLAEIAQKYGTSVDVVMALNPSITDPDFLKPGSKLILFNSCV